MQIYQLLGNIRHDGIDLEKGTFITSEDFNAEVIADLESNDAISLVPGAGSIEEAEKIVAELQRQAQEDTEVATEAETQKDTFGPIDDEVESEDDDTPPQSTGNAPVIGDEEVETEGADVEVKDETATPENTDQEETGENL